jgi:hypothetical protein
MEKLDILIWAIGAGFAITFALMKMMWHDMDAKMDARFLQMDSKFEGRFDKLEEKITDIDRRLWRLEGAFSAKECCILTSNKEMKKAG